MLFPSPTLAQRIAAELETRFRPFGYASFEDKRRATECIPPAAIEPVRTVTAPAGSEQGECTTVDAVPAPLRPTRLFAFALQLTEPSGFWLRACDGETLPRRHASERRSFRGQA